MRTRRLTLGCRRAGRGAIVPIGPGTCGDTARDPGDDAFPDTVAGLFPPGSPWDGPGPWPADDAAGPPAGQVAGGEVAGGEVAGGRVAGGQVAGGQVAGGDVASGSASRDRGAGRVPLPSAGRDPRWRDPAGRVLTARELHWNTNPGWPVGMSRTHVARGRHARPRLLTPRTATLIVAACTAVVLLFLSLLA